MSGPGPTLGVRILFDFAVAGLVLSTWIVLAFN